MDRRRGVEWGVEWGRERGFCPLEKQSYHCWTSRFRQVLRPVLVELSKVVERTDEPLMWYICPHALLLGSERPALNTFSRKYLLTQCSEIVDIENAMD